MAASERREQLLDVGRAVFAERGFGPTSVEEIAHRAGVTKPIVYEHFGGKEGLYAVVVDREMRELLDVMTRAIAAGSPRQRVAQAADAFLGYIEHTPDGFRVLLRDTPLVTGGGTTFGSLIGEIGDRVDQLLAKELAQRGFDRQLAPLYSRAVIGLIANVGQWWLETGSPSRAEVARSIENIVWNGLANLEVAPRFAPYSPGP
ncbi:MAG: TetR-family transcriptional regulator [Thermoleophilia bacterium]|jgi:AcrR family transcriptional regulator|nr:TetR-family transcriptional regulator [Thermoleophilia bacterium]